MKKLLASMIAAAMLLVALPASKADAQSTHPGLITDGVTTVLRLSRTMDGTIWDPYQGVWLTPTPESIEAADSAILETIGAGLDLVDWPVKFNFLGVVPVNIDRARIDAAVKKMQKAMRAYVTQTTAPASAP